MANVNTRFHEAYKHYLRTRTIHAATAGSLFATTADSIVESDARFESAADEWATIRLCKEKLCDFLAAVFCSSFQSNQRTQESTICFWRISAEQVFSNFLQYVTERFGCTHGSFTYLDSGYICPLAARHGHLHIIQWADTRVCRFDGFNTCLEAARYGHLDIAKWGRQNFHWLSKYHCKAAAEGGHLHIVEWAHADNPSALSGICDGLGKVANSTSYSGHGKTDMIGTSIHAGRLWNMATFT